MQFHPRLFVPATLTLFAACSTGPIEGTMQAPTGQDLATVSVLHLAANVPAVDVFVAGATTPAIRGLAYDAPPVILAAPAGRLALDVVASGRRLRTVDLNVEGGRRYTAALLDEGDVVLEEEAVGAEGTATYLRFVHAAKSVGRVDVWDLDETVRIADGLSYATATRATRIALRSKRIGVDANADGVADLVYELGDVPPNQLIDLYVVEEEGAVVLRAWDAQGQSQTTWPETTPVEPARLRVLHLSPDAGNVDVYANGDRAVQNLEFTRGTSFLQVPPATYALRVTATGASDAVLSADLPLASGEAFTVVAFGPVAQLGALVLPESPEAVTAGARIRIVHAAVGVGEVDVIDVVRGTALLEDVAFGDATPQFNAPAGVHAFGLDLNDDGRSELVFDLPELPNGASANIFAATDAEGAFLLVQLADGVTLRVRPRHVTPPATAELRAIHLSPDAPPVNLYVNENTAAAAGGLPFGEGTGYLDLDAGQVAVSVSTGALAESFLGPLALSLTEDASYSAVVFGRAAHARALLLEDDRSAAAAGLIRIRPIHAAVGVGPVNIITGGAPLYEDLAFGTAGAALEVPAGAYVLGLDVNDDHHPDLSFALPHLPAGTIANVYAAADAHGTVRLYAQLDDGTVAVIDASH